MLQTLSRVEVVERMTAQDFFRRATKDRKAELIDGVMITAPPPTDQHEKLQIFLLRLIGEYVEGFELGEVRGSRTAVKLSEDQVAEPDVLFVAKERSHIITNEDVMGAPDLVIEVLSVSTAAYDRGAKFRAYAHAGVRELWLIDPYGPAGTEFFQRAGDLLKPTMPDGTGFIASLALPGLRLQTRWLWPQEKFIPVREALAVMRAS
ncbi:MAG: Uma2 family endonuclease [Chloroflexi bacterium]|nr:Uma2 family endonuclease [Chloroflexota bacterium]